MPTQPQPPKPETLVRYARVSSVEVYEIKESELELFEKGSPADIQLNFALALLPLAIGALLILLTTTIPQPTILLVIMVVAGVGLVLGLYFLFQWHRNHTSLGAVCKTIRARMPKDAGTQGPSPANPQAPSE